MSCHARRNILPFTAIIGQEEMKKALLLNAINPRIGGVLIRGEKGTAKSTAVRALAELLPQIEVSEGCPFNCNPASLQEMCEACAEKMQNGGITAEKRQVRVVDLPLGVTEDRLCGTIDIERAIKEGVKAIEPGILAGVNRGVLYIDEVNLLDDHVADVLLDAAAMGVNVVEREGISLSHPARFILIGTMNPEEGELRPQLLDRFGLQVSVEGIEDVAERMTIVKVAEAFEADPREFRRSCERDLEDLRERVLEAQRLLPSVTISDDILELVVGTCVQMGVRTHRAEITVVRTARTIAAFDGRTEVDAEDVREAMELALPHRMRRKPFEEPKLDQDRLDEAMEHAEQQREERSQDRGEADERPPEQEEDGDGERGEMPDTPPPQGGEVEEQVYDIGTPIDPSRVEMSRRRDRVRRRNLRGRRVETLSATRAGTVLSSRYPTGTRDIALDATLRAAAPYQRRRDRNGLAVAIREDDLRERVRVGRVSTSCLFVVDASGSMGAEKRMEAAKGAVLSMLLDSYQHRDRIGLVAFRGTEADLLLPLCSSVDLARKRLEDLPTGGRTPLQAGLSRGLEALLNERRKNGEMIPMMVLISDGRANSPAGSEVREEVLGLAGEIRANGIHTVVIDTETTGKTPFGIRLGYCREIAEQAGGRYYRIGDLTPEGLREIAAREQTAVSSVSRMG
ncbi:putative cobaltochelatase [Methanofollis formosanus]|uniref:Putative cobaltochelatase n=1 Tax=Methanofollis formosanus TaxID=299308 RepID=A0A8G1EFV8_9EURY|nr:putative cobaltochelatase [Methanofollis formosanus]QYZ79183.1 putative cobaltochelatase [Methanofollis formosanus]